MLPVWVVHLKLYTKGKGSLTTWNDKEKIDVSSEGPSKPQLTF